MNISIIIPVLNEEKNILKLFDLIKKENFVKYEIIFVDDNSKDNTKKIIKQIKKYNRFIKYFNRKNKERDLSKSCKLGIIKSRYNNILIMDADLQHHPKYIKKMMKEMHKKSSDIVVACRKFNKRDKVYGLNILRFFSSIILIKIFNLISKIKSDDPMSGYFLFKKKLFYRSEKKMFLKGYKILADLLVNTNKDIKINHIYIDFYKRNAGKTKMNLKIILILLKFIFWILSAKVKN
jgi:dolichol-phosphate mannosyltransferase